MYAISPFVSRRHIVHSVAALVLTLLLGVTANTQAGSGISVSISASGISASATVGRAISSARRAAKGVR
jgi:hypothetical protein